MPLPLLRVEKPGLLTTFQDQGRPGYLRGGIPTGGAADTFASRAANVLAGNGRGGAAHSGSGRGEAVLEITLLGPVLTILHDCIAALCGGDLGASIDGAPFPIWKSVRLLAGQTVRFSGPRSGARAYLAVAGGFDIPLVLGSRSTYLPCGLGGLEGRALRAGDILYGSPTETLPRRRLGLRSADIPLYYKKQTVRVVMGPQDAAFTRQGIATFLTSEYVVTVQSDRMGCRLDGPVIMHSELGADILSEAVPFGAIQVPADGLPIILMPDGPATGGYAKIATVISVDLPLVAQASPGSRVSFEAISLNEAHDLLIVRETLFRVWENA